MKKETSFFMFIILLNIIFNTGCENNNLEAEKPFTEEQILPDHSVKITKIEKIEDRLLDLGEAPNLPLQVIISLDNGSSDTVPIEWNGFFNPVLEGKYHLQGYLYTKHKPYIMPTSPISVNLTVKDSGTKIKNRIFNYDQETCLMGAADFFFESEGKLTPLTAIDRQKVLVQETILDEYEFYVRVLESEKERKEYQDSLLLLNNYNWQQMADIMFNYNESNYELDSAFYDILPPFKDADIMYDVRVVYRYAKQQVTSPIELTEEAQELLKESPVEFKKKYGNKYISAITLGYYAAYTIPFNIIDNSNPEDVFKDIAQLVRNKDDNTQCKGYVNALTTNLIYHHGVYSKAKIYLAESKSNYINQMKSYIESNPKKKYNEMYIEYSVFNF
ncbi:Ig-like domain-containing protein [Saccharicrinis sp. FJH54]|uniref:Ig-like domain-containing protein n=1 Tax=Saccharicrinis sp. FJH54 TaxID=3344665 RepID=UPI0035D44981